MGRMIALYGLGFAAVWATILTGCVAGRVRRHFARDWDRAFVRELTKAGSAVDPDRSAPLPQRWETDPT